MSDEDYLTTAEVARRLKVKPTTVYAYVSRGLLTSTRARGRRGSLFRIAEVERLAARTVDHDGVVERIETELTLLQDDDLYYRGHRVRDLVIPTPTDQPQKQAVGRDQHLPDARRVDQPDTGQHLRVRGEQSRRRRGLGGAADDSQADRPQAGSGPVAVEGVAGLLWRGELGAGGEFSAPGEWVELARRGMGVAPVGARMADQLRIAVAVLGAGDPLRFDLTPEAVIRTAERLIGTLAEALPGATGGGPFGTRLWRKLTVRPPRHGLLDAAVILLADHGLAVSTIAARVAANARANLYSVISAGLGTLDGQYHGAATTLAYHFLERAERDPVQALSDQLRSGEPMPGFGHRIYQRRDPRAEALFELLGDVPVMATVGTLTEQVESFPNLDLAIAAMMRAYDFRPDAGEALFAIARMIGWTAHALEEYRQPGLRFRTAGIYTGAGTS